ncbi:hypothetical protein EV356DRAFT_531424 [Viridothelium virens]|uniref:Rhodopsin domain-containing protein n=1 Tax=Viridothelium virens TaxID=1048519 RepID=A0A6A6HCU8_VIRVR|nr:hypothetical protein EV356DRAFT_531424 [Viridothelium virens]
MAASAGFFPNPPVPGLDPNASKEGQLRSSGFAMIMLSFIAIVLRFTSRWLIDARILLDDWLILAALPFAWAEGIVDINGTYNYNFGKHIATLTPSTLEGFLAATWAFQLLYNFAIAFSKLSILALYWRIFHVPSFKIPLLITTSLTMSWLIACMFASVFSCIPIEGFWRLDKRSHCINNIAYYIGQAVGNILIDICLFSLPVLMISRLQISLSQKIAVMGIFLLGAFVTLTSALRLWQLILTQEHDAGDFDPTWTLVGAAVWSTVECNLSIVCACLPSMRPLLRLMLHGTLRNSDLDGYGSRYGSGNRSARGGAVTPGKRASGMWRDRGVAPGWSAHGHGGGGGGGGGVGGRLGAKRDSFMRVWSKDVRTDGRGVQVDDDGFRISTGDVPLVASGRNRSQSMKAYAESDDLEMDLAPSRPKAMPRAVTSSSSPGPGQVRAPPKNWFDAGGDRVSLSSDDLSVGKVGTAVEAAPAGRRSPPRAAGPFARKDKPMPLFANTERREGSPAEVGRVFTPPELWRLEIEKTTDVMVTEDRRR